jgi:Tetratricopeptide repeat
LDMRKKLLGAEHPDTISSMGNLANTYSNQKRWNEAEQLQIRVMDYGALFAQKYFLSRNERRCQIHNYE